MSFPLPFPPICFQCGTDQNPCHCKVVGPTLGFIFTVLFAIICWPLSIFCLCCATDAGKKCVDATALIRAPADPKIRMLSFPADTGGAISNAIPI